MLGLLKHLHTERWPVLMRALRSTSYAHGSTTMGRLESELRYLGGVDGEGVPSALSHYMTLLQGFPRDYGAMEREEKSYLQQSAFFLHDLNDVLEHVLSAYPNLDGEEREVIEQIQEEATAAIGNFRVKDIKRRG